MQNVKYIVYDYDDLQEIVIYTFLRAQTLDNRVYRRILLKTNPVMKYVSPKVLLLLFLKSFPKILVCRPKAFIIIDYHSGFYNLLLKLSIIYILVYTKKCSGLWLLPPLPPYSSLRYH